MTPFSRSYSPSGMSVDCWLVDGFAVAAVELVVLPELLQSGVCSMLLLQREIYDTSHVYKSYYTTCLQDSNWPDTCICSQVKLAAARATYGMWRQLSWKLYLHRRRSIISHPATLCREPHVGSFLNCRAAWI